MAAVTIRDLVAKYGDVVAVDGISVDVEQGHFVSLLGPSGCGKTTTLRCIAGLEEPASGTIEVAGRTVFDQRTNLPARDRNINMVFQSYAIWPHMKVAENISYGLKNQKLSRTETKQRVERALEGVGLGAYAERYGTELSGGQQQRVALARAVATEPSVLLLDEPLSNLDAALRQQMRREVVDLQRTIGKTAIYVTHDQEEALAMSDTIVLMNDGEVVQVGSPEDLYEAPNSLFAARFIGRSVIIEGTFKSAVGSDRSAEVVLPSGVTVAGHIPQTLQVPEESISGTTAHVMLRPERLRFGSADGTSPNAWDGLLRSRTYLGSRVECEVDVEGFAHPLEVHSFRRLASRVNDRVTVVIDPEDVVVLPGA